MFNHKTSNQELNKQQLDNLTNQVADGELNDEELENVDGGFWGWGGSWGCYPSFPSYDPSAYDPGHEAFLEYIRM